jgi:hypothetical protein
MGIKYAVISPQYRGKLTYAEIVCCGYAEELPTNTLNGQTFAAEYTVIQSLEHTASINTCNYKI